MTGVLYERKCTGCGETCRPYDEGPMELDLKSIMNDSTVTRHVAVYGCNNCDLLQFFEVDPKKVRYFEDLKRARMSEDIHNPTFECKDCGHHYDVHDQISCLGANEVDGERVQNCKCFKFAFTKTIKK